MENRRDEQSDLDSHEQAVFEQLTSELAEYLRLVRDAYNLIGKVMTSMPESPSVVEMSTSHRVGAMLLCRLCNDLRSAAYLAVRGYALQAGTLVASTFETAYTIAYIGGDDGRADDWTKHAEPTEPFLRLSGLLRDVLRDEPADVGYRELQCYSQLCMVKHTNPLVQKSHGVHESETQIKIFVGSDSSESALRVARHALETGVRLTLIAVDCFARAHVEATRWPRDEYDNLTEGWEQLNARARARGWEKDPYPGKWREFKK
jgi:hypothetical protein